MRRRIALTLLAGALALASVGSAFADSSFGPGNSDKGPKDPGAKCHPPGQTVDAGGCK
jgi:hypothetical protein